MRHTNDVLTDAAVTSSAFAANAWTVNKTPAEGTWMQFIITKVGADADERLNIDIHAKDTNASWATTDDRVGTVPEVGSGMATGAIVVRYAKLQTDKQYAKPRYVVSGTTPSFTIEASLVSGPAQEALV